MAQSSEQLEMLIKKNPNNISARTRLARLFFDQNKPEKAIELLNPYTDQLKEEDFLLLALSYSRHKDFSNEVRVLNMLVSKDENNFRWHMLLGQAYLKQANEITEANRNREVMTSGIQRLRRALQLNPQYKPAFDLLLATFLQQKANNEARELLMEGLSKFGRRPELYRELCRLDSQDGFLVQAVSNCAESIKLAPEYADQYVYLVQALHDQKEDVRAEKQITLAARRFPKNEFVQWAAGELFLRKKNYPVSARYFEAAVAAKSDSGRAQFGLAKALFESGSEEKALKHFTEACKLDGSSLETFMAATGRMKQKGNSQLTQEYIRASNTCR